MIRNLVYGLIGKAHTACGVRTTATLINKNGKTVQSNLPVWADQTVEVSAGPGANAVYTMQAIAVLVSELTEMPGTGWKFQTATETHTIDRQLDNDGDRVRFIVKKGN